MHETPDVSRDPFWKWLTDNHFDDLRAIAEKGAHACNQGFSYYRDTTPIYDRYSDEIWTLLRKEARALGYPNVLLFLGSSAFAYSEEIKSHQQLQMYLVWHIAEVEAKALVAMMDNKD